MEKTQINTCMRCGKTFEVATFEAAAANSAELTRVNGAITLSPLMGQASRHLCDWCTDIAAAMGRACLSGRCIVTARDYDVKGYIVPDCGDCRYRPWRGCKRHGQVFRDDYGNDICLAYAPPRQLLRRFWRALFGRRGEAS